MMHDPTGHPDDERLSALAAGDDDARADVSLRKHVDGCERCATVVDDLLALRTALAQLPDVAASRPLQLVPPVPRQRRPTRLGGFARRLFAPALVAGVVLTVAGGVGTYVTNALPASTAAGGAAVFEAEGGVATDAAAPAAAGASDTADAHSDRDDTGASRLASAPEPADVPWLVLLGAGIALVIAAVVLRFLVQPRAG